MIRVLLSLLVPQLHDWEFTRNPKTFSSPTIHSLLPFAMQVTTSVSWK
jgi:hypothetical protein